MLPVPNEPSMVSHGLFSFILRAPFEPTNALREDNLTGELRMFRKEWHPFLSMIKVRWQQHRDESSFTLRYRQGTNDELIRQIERRVRHNRSRFDPLILQEIENFSTRVRCRFNVSARDFVSHRS